MIHYTLVNLSNGGSQNIIAENNKEALGEVELVKCKKSEANFILEREDKNYNPIQYIYCK